MELRHVAERWSRTDLVPAVEAVAEAEFEVHSGWSGRMVRGEGVRTLPEGVVRVVLAQVPVLVVDVHLDVEGVANLRVAEAARVEDDLRVTGLRNGHVADVRHVGGDLARGRVIRQAATNHVLH
jgi:hypothetical protein